MRSIVLDANSISEEGAQAADPDKTVALIFGLSHANSLKRAVDQFGMGDDNFAFRVVANGTAGLPGGAVTYRADGSAMLSPIIQRAIQANLRRATRPKVWLISAMGGNEGNRLSLIQHPDRFDFVDPSHPDDPIDAGARMIPYDVVAETMQASLAGLEQMLTLAKQHRVQGVVQIGPAPPLRDPDTVRMLLSERTVKAAVSRGVDPEALSISSDALRLKVWRLESRLTQALCEKVGVLFVQPRNDQIGADGMRGPESAADAIHCGPEWGRAVLNQAADMIRSTGKAN